MAFGLTVPLTPPVASNDAGAFTLPATIVPSTVPPSLRSSPTERCETVPETVGGTEEHGGCAGGAGDDDPDLCEVV